jgi:DNA repair protein RecN (Recombination protein N)
MIEEIRITDVGVIDEASLELTPGLNVLTGETGAGKTMILTALGMVLGGKVDPGRVRVGSSKASAEAILGVDPSSPALQRAIEAGAVDEDDDVAELILARTVSSSGRSRAILSGRMVPASVLNDVGAHLVAVHGQTDQLRLKSPSAQRRALDRFGGQELASVKADYRRAFDAYESARRTHEEISTSSRERKLEAAQLQAALLEIDELRLQPREDETLKADAMRLENVEGLRAAGAAASAALTGVEDALETPNALELIESARRSLDSETDPLLAGLSQRLSAVAADINDVAVDLASFVTDLDTEGPERLNEIQDRRSAINQLTRKYAPTVDEVLAWAEAKRPRLAELGDDDETLERLERERDEALATAQELAARLSALRQTAAADLASRVSEELTALAMPSARLSVTVDPADRLDRHGADVVALLLKPHSGAPAQPLGRGASGGELSRVMLAIEVVLAGVDPVPTFVFDEVDAGVGGKAAVAIGERLAMLARHVQVIVVTHLPQVAAFAENHIRILKGESDGVTASDVAQLSPEERVTELARMLAGHETSDAAKAHAQELIDDAQSFAARDPRLTVARKAPR